jgi:hypothetical protein
MPIPWFPWPLWHQKIQHAEAQDRLATLLFVQAPFSLAQRGDCVWHVTRRTTHERTDEFGIALWENALTVPDTTLKMEIAKPKRNPGYSPFAIHSVRSRHHIRAGRPSSGNPIAHSLVLIGARGGW